MDAQGMLHPGGMRLAPQTNAGGELGREIILPPWTPFFSISAFPGCWDALSAHTLGRGQPGCRQEGAGCWYSTRSHKGTGRDKDAPVRKQQAGGPACLQGQNWSRALCQDWLSRGAAP